MSSGSISDPGDVGEGEGPKVVQSSFREPSIMNKSSIKNPPPVIEKTIPEVKDSPPITKENFRPAEEPLQNKKKTEKKKEKIVDHFSFEIPKMIGIPILNKDTVNPDTFDLNYFLNPEVQKLAQSGHRLTQSTAVPSGKVLASPKNFVQKNILLSKKLADSKSTKDLPAEIPEIVLKKPKIDIEERFYKKAKKTEEKIKNMKAAKDLQEVDGCTFQPKIKSKRQNKTYEEFYEYMKNFVNKKNSKILNLKAEEDKAIEKSLDFTHQPKLCDKSLQMIAKKSDLEESTFDRLHKLYKGKSINTNDSMVFEAKNDEPSVFFHPTVNKKSQMMSRTQPVDKILYEDALRRINKDKTPPLPAPTKFITVKSEKVLIEKLKRDFSEAFLCIDIEKNNEINYSKVIELCKLLYLVRDDNKREEERLLLLEA